MKVNLHLKKILIEFDIVINCMKRAGDLSFLEPLDLDISKRGKIIGGYNDLLEQTKYPHIFAAGDILHGAVHNEPGATGSGKRVAAFINARRNKDFKTMERLKDFDLSLMPYCLFSTPEIGGLGITEIKAEQIYKKGEVTSITLKKTGYLDKLTQMAEVQNYNNFNLIKIIFETDSRKVIGLFYLGNHAAEVIQGYAVRINLNFYLGCYEKWNYFR